MKKTILKAIGVIILAVLMVIYVIADREVNKGYVGDHVVILGDTLKIVKYDFRRELVTLEDDRVISIHFIKENLIRDKK